MSIRQLTAPRYLSTFFCRPGMKTYLPGSTHFLQMFPTAFRLYSCRYDESELLKEVVFPDLGPISGWMVSVDTMRHAVFVEGRGAAGFFRYRIDATPDGIVFRSLKSTMKVRMVLIVILDAVKSWFLLTLHARLVDFPLLDCSWGAIKSLAWSVL